MFFKNSINTNVWSNIFLIIELLNDKYRLSKIMLPSWLCIDNHTPFDEILAEKPCYVNFYGKNALENA